MHLRFTFKHRSRNEAREKLGPAPWALAYLKLVNDSNGTTVRDGVHDLLVYKIEKKFDLGNPTYLDLPSLKTNQTGSHKHKLQQYNNNLSLITKDVLTVHTTLCSTKLTQNLGLLSLLKWRSEPDNLKHNPDMFIIFLGQLGLPRGLFSGLRNGRLGILNSESQLGPKSKFVLCRRFLILP